LYGIPLPLYHSLLIRSSIDHFQMCRAKGAPKSCLFLTHSQLWVCEGRRRCPKVTLAIFEVHFF
jgi:hypothetical protein